MYTFIVKGRKKDSNRWVDIYRCPPILTLELHKFLFFKWTTKKIDEETNRRFVSKEAEKAWITGEYEEVVGLREFINAKNVLSEIETDWWVKTCFWENGSTKADFIWQKS